jgi:hypothetical protein
MIETWWNHLYCVILVGSVRWVGHVASIGARRNYYNILVGKYEQKRHLGKTGDSKVKFSLCLTNEVLCHLLNEKF